MKHLKKNRKFSRRRDQRAALLNSLARNFFSKGRMRTTQAKAKEIKPIVEKILTKAKKGDLAARRSLLRYFSPALSKKIIEEITPIYQSRQGGYCRIIRLNQRKSDGAQMAIIELVKS